jgi:hypothetical protein
VNTDIDMREEGLIARKLHESATVKGEETYYPRCIYTLYLRVYLIHRLGIRDQK